MAKCLNETQEELHQLARNFIEDLEELGRVRIRLMLNDAGLVEDYSHLSILSDDDLSAEFSLLTYNSRIPTAVWGHLVEQSRYRPIGWRELNAK